MEIFAPLVRGRKGEYYQLLYDLLGKGYSHVLVDGKRQALRERIELSKTKRHDIDVLVDSISILDFIDSEADAQERLAESLEKALEESDGLVKILFRDMGREQDEKDYKPEEVFMSSKLSCPKDGYSYPEVEPRLFSFNSQLSFTLLLIPFCHFFAKCISCRLLEYIIISFLYTFFFILFTCYSCLYN